MDKEKYIILKAKELFSTEGYKGTTMHLLSRKCDIGKGTLYLYFSSKEELLKAIVDQLIDDIKDKADKIQEMKISFNEQIMLFLHEMLYLKQEHICVAKLVYEAKQIGNQTVNKYVDKIDNYIIDTVKEKIDLAIKANHIKDCNSKFMAFLIYKIYILLVLEWEEKANTKLTESELYGLLENLFRQQGGLCND